MSNKQSCLGFTFSFVERLTAQRVAAMMVFHPGIIAVELL